MAINNYSLGAIFSLSEKIIKMLLQLVYFILLVRYLEKSDMGGIMMCYAISSIFMFFNGMGLGPLFTNYFVKYRILKAQVLLNGIFLRFLGGSLAVVVVNAVGYFFVSPDYYFVLIVLSLIHIFMPATIYEWYFQSVGRADVSSICLILTHVIVFIFRVVVIALMEGDVILLAFSYVLELILLAVFYLYASIFGFKVVLYRDLFSYRKCIKILNDSKSLLLSGVVVLLYMKVDQIMIGVYLGEESVAVYVAGTRLSEAWYFVGLSIIGVYFPKALSELKNNGLQAYHNVVTNIAMKVVWGGIFLSILTFFIASWLIDFLYGDGYELSALVLSISIWTVPFVFLGNVSTNMYVVKSQQNVVLARGVIGLVLNVILNFALIPMIGVVGAAISTVVSQAVASYVFNYFVKESSVFEIQTKAIFLKA